MLFEPLFGEDLEDANLHEPMTAKTRVHYPDGRRADTIQYFFLPTFRTKVSTFQMESVMNWRGSGGMGLPTYRRALISVRYRIVC